ncbi:MAG: hypothetical protein WCC22_00855 [Terriglobales bacterium]
MAKALHPVLARAHLVRPEGGGPSGALAGGGSLETTLLFEGVAVVIRLELHS